MSTDETADITVYTCADPHPTLAYRCTKRRGHSGMHGVYRIEGGGFEKTWPVIHPAPDALADVVVNPVLLQNATLPERMRAAADTLDDVNARYDRRDIDGSPLAPNLDATTLRIIADRWERFDNREAAKEEQVQELARALFDAGWSKVTTAQARQLIDDGWTKGEKAP